MTESRIYTGIRTALFDFDGVLLNSAEDISFSVNTALEHFGAKPVPTEKIITYVGDGARTLIERAVRFSLFRLDKYESIPDDVSDESADMRKRFDELMKPVYPWYSDYYRAHATVYSSLYPGAIELLDNLKGKGMRIGLVSNKPLKASMRILSHFGIDTYFDAVVGPELLTRIKPDPEGILLALEKTACRPENAIMVGDTATDIQAARAAGTVSCAFTQGFGDTALLLAENADIVISRLWELAGRIEV